MSEKNRTPEENARRAKIAFQGQHRTILGTRLACGYFRHSSQKSSEIRQGFPAVFVSIDENPDSAIHAPQLCGVALNNCAADAPFFLDS